MKPISVCVLCLSMAAVALAQNSDPAPLPGPTPGPAPGGDTTPPAAVTNLGIDASQITATSIPLKWTAPGDDGSTGTAAQYDLRYTTAGPITTLAEFTAATACTGEPAPSPAGQSDSFVVTGLQPGTTYWFCLRTADEVPNWSNLSNSPSGTTANAAPDTTPPAAIMNLVVTGTGVNDATLQWTAPGDDGSTGTAAQYDVRYSTTPILSDPDFLAATPASGAPTPAPAGTVETFTVSSLSPLTTYYFAVKTADEVPNWSTLSNSASGTTQPAPDLVPPAAVTDLAATGSTFTTIDLRWTAPGDDGLTGTAAAYDLRYSLSPIATDPEFQLATPVMGLPAPSPAGTIETLTVGGLLEGRTYYFAVKTRDEVNNWSPLSNSPAGSTQVDPVDHGAGDRCIGSSSAGASISPLALLILLSLLSLSGFRR